jgi:alpha-1,2-mannosyltransferase
MRIDRRLLVVLAVGAVTWTWMFVVLVVNSDDAQIDLDVYRTGGRAWLDGLSLYGDGFPYDLPGPRLPFTYPPVSAALFAALTVLPWWLAVTVLMGAGLAGLAWACHVVAGRLVPDEADRRRAVLLVASGVAVAPLLEPVRQTVSFGQINLILAGLIAADCLLRRTPWPRGALIGVAAAIKLTPAAFALFFVARRQWRPVLVAVGAFVLVGLLGWALAPADTRRYWFDVLLDPNRIGRLEFTSNQSIRGLLHRFELPAGPETALWLGLSAVVGVLAWAGVAALRRRGDDVAALLVVAAATLLVSPVSWSHHWVWAVLGLLWLAEYVRRVRTSASVALLLGALAVFACSPHWWLPYRDGREFAWNAGEHLLGNAYLWAGLAVVVAGAVYAARHPAGAEDAQEPVTARQVGP